MKTLVSGALQSAMMTLVAAIALRALDPAVAVAALAGVVVLLSWYAQLAATDEGAGLDTTHPNAAVALAVVHRRDWSTALPLVTAQLVGGIATGLLMFGLARFLYEPLPYDANGLVIAGVGGALVGLVGAWATLAVDGDGPVAFAAVPVLVSGALPLALVGAFSPAVVLGLAAAGLIGWTAAAVAAITSILGAALGALLVGALLPD